MLALAALAGLSAAALSPAAAPRRRPQPSARPQAGKKTDDRHRPIATGGMGLAELARLYEAHSHVGVDGQLPYRLLRPLVYHPSRKYPMVVCLHGYPGQGSDNLLQLSATYPAGVLARPAMRQKYPCFVLVPQAPHWWGDGPYGKKGARWPAGGKGKHIPAMSMLLETIQDLLASLSIDRDRVYITGHGMGGFGVFNALASDPNMFAAAVVVSGGGDPNAAWTFCRVPVWLFAGRESPILHYSREMVDAITAAGGRPTFTVLPDMGTNCWAKVYEAPATWDWLFSQRRVPRAWATSRPASQPASRPASRPAGVWYYKPKIPARRAP